MSALNPTTVVLAFIILMTGGLLTAMPWITPKRECFTVTVPETAQHDARLMAFKQQYAIAMFVITVASTIACLIVFSGAGSNDWSGPFASALPFVLTAATMIPVAVSFGLMLHYRSHVRAIKETEGWQPACNRSVAFLGDVEIPQPLALSWNLLYIPIILFTLAIGLIGYPGMPDFVPMHADFAGNVNRWEPKGPGVIAFPILMQLFLAACMVFSHWSIIHSKKPVDPESPAASALAYGMFARAQSAFLIASGLVLTAVLGFAFMISSLGYITLGQAAAAILFVTVLVVVGAIVLSVIYGQSGSRVFNRMQNTDLLLHDDDAQWKLGIFYWNPDDASLFLPERFGVGWTMNFARPAAWAIIIGGFAITVAFVVVVSLIA
jgi:uncharacterized membrane protein